jgi:hypothetical protein
MENGWKNVCFTLENGLKKGKTVMENGLDFRFLLVWQTNALQIQLAAVFEEKLYVCTVL